MENAKQKTIKIIKLAVVIILSIAVAYIIYAVTAGLIVWTQQPQFTSGSVTTSSYGFLIQSLITAGIGLIFATALIICLILFYKKKKTE